MVELVKLGGKTIEMMGGRIGQFDQSNQALITGGIGQIGWKSIEIMPGQIGWKSIEMMGGQIGQFDQFDQALITG